MNKFLERLCVSILALSSVSLCGPAVASETRVAYPFYTAEQALQGVYAHHLPPLSQRFAAQADALAAASQQHCAALPTLHADFAAQQSAWVSLHRHWQQTMAAWEALSTPAIGPVLTRRSQRQIDFWPTRPELVGKGVAKAPQTLAEMEQIGNLAKGLPAMDLLLAQWQPKSPARVRTFDARGLKPGDKPAEVPLTSTPMPAATCQYLSLLSQGVQTEAHELSAELTRWAAKDWLVISEVDLEATRAAFAEWLNQWLGGVERLRWMHIEKPIKAVQTLGNSLKGNGPAFARRDRTANLAGWRAQWTSLRAQGQLDAAQRQTPPVPGRALVPIEALLLGKGHISLAHRWSQALNTVSTRLDALPAEALTRAADLRQLLAVSAALKTVTVLFQNEVASALDLALGFSDADGD